MHQYRQVLVRMRLGDSDRTIARAGLMGRRKVQAVREVADKQGWLDPEQSLPDDEALALLWGVKRGTPPTPSLIGPYEEEVKAWRDQGIQGTTIYQALVSKYGFTGSYSSVRRFLQGLEKANPVMTTVLEFEPGDSAQVDFGAGPKLVDLQTGELLKSWIFVMVLSWSRHMYAEIVRDQSVDTWLRCHRHAFSWFFGVPRRVIIDNPKCAITTACYHDPQVQRAYADCAEGFGFLIAPCPVRDPKKKGRVESGVKYVKNNFVPLRTFRDLPDANQQLLQWLRETAGNRVHGTTHERPWTRFTETERHLLKPLPEVLPEVASWARVKVHGDCHVQFEKCRYSVPFKLVHQSLWLRASDTSVRIYLSHELQAIHARLTQPGRRSTLDEHLPPEAYAYKMRDPQWCLQQAKQVGPACKDLVERLFSHRVLDNLRAAQGIVSLRKRYGDTRLEAACQRALAFDNPRYNAVKQILEKGLDQDPSAEAAFDELAESYAGGGRFCRNTKHLLTH